MVKGNATEAFGWSVNKYCAAYVFMFTECMLFIT